MGAFDKFFGGGKAQVETTPASQQVEQQVEQPAQDSLEERMLAFLAGMEQRIMTNVEQQIASAVADSPQVAAPSAPVTPAAPANTGWISIADHKGTLTQHEDERVRSAAGYANSNLGGYPQFVKDGALNVAEIERLRAERDASNGHAAPAVTASKPASNGKSRPAPKNVPVTPLESLVKQDRFSKLSVLLPSNKNHAHWNGTVELADGTTLVFKDFPYNLALESGKSIPRTLKVLMSAYFAHVLVQMPGGTGGVRDQFSHAIATALNAKSNGEFAHAMSGHRNADDWLTAAGKALGTIK